MTKLAYLLLKLLSVKRSFVRFNPYFTLSILSHVKASNIKYYLLTFIVVFNTVNSQSCNDQYVSGQYVNALKLCETELITARNEERSELLLIIIDLYHELGEFEKQSDYLQLLKESPDFKVVPKLRFKWNSWTGILSYYSEDLDKAEKMFFEELSIALLANNKKWIAKSYNDLGVIAHARMNFKSSLEYYNKSLDLYKEANNDYKSGVEYHNIGSIYLLLENYEKANEYFTQALKSYDLYSKSNESDVKVAKQIKHAYESLLRVSLTVEDLELADKYGAQVMKLSSNDINPQDINHSILDFVRLYISKEHYDLAGYFLNKAIEKNHELGDGFNSDLSILKARLYQKTGLSSAAIVELKSTLKQIGNENYIALSKVNMLLSELYQESNPKASLNYMKKHQIQREKLLQQKYDSSIKAIQYEIETKKIENELNLERIERISSDLKIKTLNNKFLLSTIAILFLLSIVISLYLVKRREKRQLLDKIKQHKQQLILMDEKSSQNYENQQVSKQDFCIHLVKIMNDAVNIWEEHTKTNRVELADRSKIWTISVDDGTLRTRSLDKYLSVDKIPKNPRWRNVVRTCHFILSDSTIGKNNRNKLEDNLSSLLSMVQNL